MTAELGGSTPVAFFGLPGDEVPTSQANLSAAYGAFSLRLRSRGLLGGGTSPLIEELAAVAERLAGLLSKHATFSAGEPGAAVELQLSLAASDTRLDLAHLREREAPGLGIDDVVVSYVRNRVVVPGTLSEKIAALDGISTERLCLSGMQIDALNRHFKGKTFDGVLPSLPGQRLERDPASGRTRLHLILGEASFSSVLASHYVGRHGVGKAPEDVLGEAGLLTLAILPTTTDGYLVLTTRSRYVSITAGQTSPAVTGNLEMRDRTGLKVDRDADGLPDPLLALRRECREELALEVSRERIQVLAIMRFASPQEVGTTVLLTTAALDSWLYAAKRGKRPLIGVVW